jgi:hypothetical protein
MASTGIPNDAPNDITYHYGPINQDSTCWESGAERYGASDNVHSGTRTDKIPNDEYGAES